jgi:hypothetical protein
VDYWLGLPIDELTRFMLELNHQIKEENEAMKAG